MCIHSVHGLSIVHIHPYIHTCKVYLSHTYMCINGWDGLLGRRRGAFRLFIRIYAYISMECIYLINQFHRHRAALHISTATSLAPSNPCHCAVKMIHQRHIANSINQSNPTYVCRWTPPPAGGTRRGASRSAPRRWRRCTTWVSECKFAWMLCVYMDRRCV